MKKILVFLSDVLAGFCLGTIIDYFAETSYLYTLLGTGAGIILAVILTIISKGKEGK